MQTTQQPDQLSLTKLICKHYGLSAAEQVQMYSIMFELAERFIKPAVAAGDPEVRNGSLLTVEAALRVAAAFATETRLNFAGPGSDERAKAELIAAEAVDGLADEQVKHTFSLQIDTPAAIALIKMLQVGLQHPGSSGTVATLSRELLEQMIETVESTIPQLRPLIALGLEGFIR